MKKMVDGEVIDMTPEEEAEHVARAAAVVVPSVVSMRQARLALLAAGLLDTVMTAVQAAGVAAWIEWEYAAEVRRDAPLVEKLSTLLNLSSGQIDEMFVEAAKL